MKNDDIRILRDIEQYYSTQIDEMPMNGEWRGSGGALHPPAPGMALTCCTSSLQLLISSEELLELGFRTNASRCPSRTRVASVDLGFGPSAP